MKYVQFTDAVYEKLKAALKGCGDCTYEEADGELFRHCDNCMERVTTIMFCDAKPVALKQPAGSGGREGRS